MRFFSKNSFTSERSILNLFCIFIFLFFITSAMAQSTSGQSKRELKQMQKSQNNQHERNKQNRKQPKGKKQLGDEVNQNKNKDIPEKKKSDYQLPLLNNDNPSTFTLISGRPTDKSITLNTLANADISGHFEYTLSQEKGNAASARTEEQSFPAGKPVETLINGLKPDAEYTYRFIYHHADEKAAHKSENYSFHTQRLPGSSFKFAVQADPHNQDPNVNFELYTTTAENIRKAKPDFLIDLGDNFMTEKIARSQDEARLAYISMRPYYAITSAVSPLYLTIGNHDGELGWKKNGGENCLAIWSNIFRKSYYPCPTADSFYSGSKTQEPFVGTHDGYYAWQWGDALFIVIDPYWYTTISPQNKQNDNWSWTLGKEQYDWFAKTLKESRAKYRFVFSHQLVGGSDQGRGGTEFAGLYEWGGADKDGTYKFDEKRPGWGKPIHQLMKENKVNIFFHGHDHFFGKQELDGVIYQLVPQPDQTNKRFNQKDEYGYKDGILLSNSGYLLINISPENAKVSYILSTFEDKNSGSNQKTEYEYTFTPR